MGAGQQEQTGLSALMPRTLRGQKEVGFTWAAARHTRSLGLPFISIIFFTEKQALRGSLGVPTYRETCSACALCFQPTRHCPLPGAASHTAPELR